MYSRVGSISSHRKYLRYGTHSIFADKSSLRALAVRQQRLFGSSLYARRTNNQSRQLALSFRRAIGCYCREPTFAIAVPDPPD